MTWNAFAKRDSSLVQLTSLQHQAMNQNLEEIKPSCSFECKDSRKKLLKMQVSLEIPSKSSAVSNTEHPMSKQDNPDNL
jgi:hypothetical protein